MSDMTIKELIELDTLLAEHEEVLTKYYELGFMKGGIYGIGVTCVIIGIGMVATAFSEEIKRRKSIIKFKKN